MRDRHLFTAVDLGMEIRDVHSENSESPGRGVFVLGCGVCIAMRSSIEWRYINAASRKHSATSWRRFKVSGVRPWGIMYWVFV